jgi:acetyl-CoA acetyltransferase
MALCEMGFCEPADVHAFVSGGRPLGPDAELPFNTSGGNLGEGYIHGFELVNEAVRQVRGESTCQVARVERSLAVAGPGTRPAAPCCSGLRRAGHSRWIAFTILGSAWLLPVPG